MWIPYFQLRGKDDYEEGDPFQGLIQINEPNLPSFHTKYTCHGTSVLMQI